MPAPRWLAHFNRHVTNRLLSPMAARRGGFGIVIHTGRKSQRQYRTPVNIFPIDGGYTIGLTYGRDSEWVRNVLAKGGCQLETEGRILRLTNPRLTNDRRRRDQIVQTLPRALRPLLDLVAVSDFLDLDLVDDPVPATA